MDLSELPTPAAVLDRAKLTRNAERMRARAEMLGVTLRPHMKTAKSADVARVALGDGPGPITVATLREAEHFAEEGFTDITYAVCIVPSKLDAVATLNAKGADIKILTDDPDVARAIAADGRAFKVLIEIDCGEHRTGTAPDGDALLAIAEDERAAAVLAAERLRAAGHDCATVSVGSTPTASFAESLSGVTEMRPGVYTLGDLFQAGIGSCTRDDIACTVLASVIAHRESENALLLDAGGLALSKDRSTAKLEDDCGYGLVCDADTGAIIEGLWIDDVHQEHGHVTAETPLPFERLPVGARVRVMPNHVCMTAAAYDRYHVVDGGTDVVAVWERCNGW